jgi:hypothetical protein
MEKFQIKTGGDGLWSREKRDVTITGMEVEGQSLLVFFDKRTWNIERHGLIYTDREFEKELKKKLTEMGLPSKSLSYSEQGLQGDDYVHFDVSREFANKFNKM